MKNFRRLKALVSVTAMVLGASSLSASTVTPLASAPALTSVKVIYVYAPSTGTESISPNQYSTATVYGGIPVQVTIQQIGYSKNMWGYLNGSVTNVSMINQTLICGTSAAPTSCSGGQTVIGFNTTFQISGNSTGQFSAKLISANAPFNTLTTYLNIR